MLLFTLITLALVNSQKIGVTLFQWTFNDIATECTQFLADAKYDYVLTSPVQGHILSANSSFPWTISYQPLGFSIGNRLGSLSDFQNMISKCKSVGVDVVVDVVLNHNAAATTTGSNGFGSNQSWSAEPFKENFPDAGLQSIHYHDSICNYSVANYSNDFEVWNCRIFGLVDLKTEDSFVQGLIVSFLNNLLSLGVLGFRIDTAKGVPPSDWEIIYSKVNKNYRGEKAFIHQEVMYPFSDNSYKNYSSFGLISNFDYGVQIGKSFRNVDGQSTRLIPDFIRTGILKSSESITLIENHDKERDYDGDTNYALSRINNAWWYKQAIAFNLLYPFGSPLIHSGFRITYINSSYSVPISAPMNSYGDLISIGEIKNNVCPDSWTCQHRWPEVAALVQTRSYLNKLIQPDTPLPDIYTEDRNRIYWSVLNKTFVAINSAQGNETAQTWSKFVQTGLPMGTYCNIMYAYSSGGKCVLLPGVVLTSEQWTYSVNSTGHTFLKIGQADRSRVVVLVDNSLTNDAVRLMPWIFWIILFACL